MGSFLLKSRRHREVPFLGDVGDPRHHTSSHIITHHQCRSVLQCATDYSVVECCSMLQYVAVCCSVSQCVAVRYRFECRLECCRVLQCDTVCCSILQCVAVCCSHHHTSSHMVLQDHLLVSQNSPISCQVCFATRP